MQCGGVRRLEGEDLREPLAAPEDRRPREVLGLTAHRELVEH